MLPVEPCEVLLVEDNAGDVRLTREALRQCDVPSRLNVVTDGEAALSLLRQRAAGFAPDLIVLDLNLPRMDGFELLTELKQDPKLRHIPVVVLTSSVRSADVERAYHLHAACFVSKPAGFDEFAEAIAGIAHFWFRIATLHSAIT